jgi:hypothetical protein
VVFLFEAEISTGFQHTNDLGKRQYRPTLLGA